MEPISLEFRGVARSLRIVIKAGDNGRFVAQPNGHLAELVADNSQAHFLITTNTIDFNQSGASNFRLAVGLTSSQDRVAMEASVDTQAANPSVQLITRSADGVEMDNQLLQSTPGTHIDIRPRVAQP